MNHLVKDGMFRIFNHRVNKKTLLFSTVSLSLFCAFGASAITAPAEGSFAYDLYDVGVNMILKGAPGFIGGVVGIVYSASQLTNNWKAAGLGILGSSAVLKADTITTSLGMII